jgi:hypothetical protein
MNKDSHNAWFELLLKAPRIRAAGASIREVSDLQGVYVLWFNGEAPMCLKVGIAGPRNGEGLAGRIKLHCSSNPGNTVLARHMSADLTPPCRSEYDFRDRQERAKFLAEECCFQVLELPALSRAQLRSFERFLETKLQPKYMGRVNDKKGPGNDRENRV